MGLSVVTPPATELMTLEEARLHLRLDAAGSPLEHPDDPLVTKLIKAARTHAENFTRRVFINTELKYTIDRFPERTRYDYCDPDRQAIKLPVNPVRSITHLKYLDADGALQTLASADYQKDLESEPARLLHGTDDLWPAVQEALNAVEVQFVAGYGIAPSDVPEGITAAVKLLLGHLYENREAVIVGTSAVELPFAVETLLWPYRLFPE